MESNIEIVIKSDGKKVMMQCHGKDTSKEKALYVMQKAYLALVVSLLKEELTKKERAECAADFGMMMAEDLLDVMEGRSCELGKEKDKMTLQEAMNYRGENPATLSDKLAVQEGYVRRWCKPGGLLKLSAGRLQQLAQALDGGILIAEDGAEVELYGNGGRS